MTTEQKRIEEYPHIPFNIGDLEILVYVVAWYMAYLRGGAFSHRHAAKLRVLQDLHRRLAGIPANTQEARIVLTFQDVYTLDDVIASFVSLWRQRVPKSLEREALLQDFERLRGDLSRMMYPIVD